MMEGLISNEKGTFNVHLSGGSPWGFTLHGGSEFNSKLYIKRITPGGKASKSKAIQVGDEVLCVNDIECSTRAKAIEYVKDSGQTLQLTIKRTSNDSIGNITSTRQNGIKDKSGDSPSKKYASGLDEVQQNDFYSTYSVDPIVYAKIVQKTRDNNNKMANSFDNELSASNEDLLNRYRTRGVAGSEEELDNIERSSFSNGRLSPNKELSGHSVPESQLHGRTFTSPGRIQKVKITSTNISSSSSTFSSPDDEGSRHHSRISPVKHSPIARQFHKDETETTPDRDNWFERWLRDDKSHSTTDKDISVKDACSKFEEEEGRQAAPKSPTSNRSNFSRSKSFSGRPSYGVVFGTTAVKSDDQRSEITAYQAPLPSTTRYNSADLLRDKERRNIPAESWKHVEVETSPRKVTPIQEERNVQRMNRKSLGSYPMVSSTSSLDWFGGARQQGPAIPPRRSESKLLRSMRRGKSATFVSGTTRQALQKEDNKPKHSVSNSWPSDYLGSTAPLVNNRQSWPPEDIRVESDASSRRAGAKRSTSVVIKSVRTSTSSSDGNTKPKIYRSSSVEMKPDYTETEATRPKSAQARTHPSTEEKPRHQQQPQQEQHDLPSHQHQRPQQHHKPQQHRQPQNVQRTHQQPVQQQQQQQPQQQQHHLRPYQRPQQQIPKIQYTQQRLQHQQQKEHQQQPQQQQSYREEADSLSSRIEDTQILQKLMKDSQVVSPPQTVMSRIQKIEKSSSQPNLLEGPDVKPGVQHHKQRSWDNSYAAFSKTFSSARSELRATGRFGSTERLLDSIEHDEAEQSKTPSSVEKPISPVKVISREIAPTTRTVVQSTTQEEKPQKRYDSLENPINEQVLRTESSSTLEKEVYLEEMFKHLEEKPTPTKNTKQDTNRNLAIQTQSERNIKLSIGDDDVFTTLDDSLPPPPPPSYSYHETSSENLPLPTPPRELLVREPFRVAISRDKNRNDVYNSEPKSNERQSYTESNFNTKDSDVVIHKVVNNEDLKGLEDRKHSGEETLNVKNSKYEERFNERKTDNIEDNYINTEYNPTPSPKEKTFIESTSPSKSELDSTETLISKQSPIVRTSTPTRSESNSDERASPDSDRGGNTSPLSGSSLSTPSSSRPGSMMSPKLEQLDKEKCELVDSMKKKIQDLRTQMNEITEEINENEKLGEKVTVLVEGKATPSEFSKYQRFTGELNKIVLLLLSLTQRMHRYENTLQELDMSEEADRQQRDILLDKIDHVKSQYEEACKIKEVNDKRGEVVSGFLENYLDEDEFADFQYYIDMKTQLALMHAEIKDKVKMGEERLNTLSATAIDWNVSSFCGY